MTDEHDRRKGDVEFARFMGEIEQWKKESIDWRVKTDEKLTEIIGFMEEVRTPRRIIIWTVRAVIVGALGSIATAVTAFIKGHLLIK